MKITLMQEQRVVTEQIPKLELCLKLKQIAMIRYEINQDRINYYFMTEVDDRKNDKLIGSLLITKKLKEMDSKVIVTQTVEDEGTYWTEFDEFISKKAVYFLYKKYGIGSQKKKMIDFINKLIASNDEYIYLIGVNAEIYDGSMNVVGSTGDMRI